MFSKKDINLINKELVNLVKQLDYVDLLCIHGSRAVGREYKKSDLDYYILLKKNKLKELYKLINKTSLECIEQYKYLFYGFHCRYKGLRVSIHLLETKKFENRLKSLFKSKKQFEENQGFARGWVQEAVPLYNPNKLLKKFKKYIKYDLKFQKKFIKENKAKLKKFSKYTKLSSERAVYVFYSNLKEIISTIIEILYLKNKSFQVSFYKTLDADIKKFKPNIEKELKYLIEKPNTQKYLKNKIKVIMKINESYKI